MATWRSVVPILFVAALIAFDDLIPVPSCVISGGDERGDSSHPDDLKVMMVADLLLKGPDAGFVDRSFRNIYISKFLKKSLEKLKPDMLLVLGDIAAKGSELTASEWLRILQQFQEMLGPFMGIPFHIVLGDRDIGECSKLDRKVVDQIASNLPGLNSEGSGAFEISHIGFVSLNAVALLCGNNDLRFGVERVIESERIDLQNQMIDSFEETIEPNKRSAEFGNFRWRANDMASGSGPVVILHIPLHQTAESKFTGTDILRDSHHENQRNFVNSGNVDVGPYDKMHTLPPNVTEYIFFSLKPRMIFSAHTHHFHDYIHSDGTREVTVPAFSWSAKDEPGFVVAIFGQNKTVTVSCCSLARESHVIIAYILMLVFLIVTTLVARWSFFINLVR